MRPGLPWRRLAPPVVSLLVFMGAVALFDRPLLFPARADAPLGEEEQERILGALSDFQRVYKDFFVTAGGVSMLDACPATTEVKHRVFTDIGFLRDAGLVLVQDLAQVTVLGVRRDGPAGAEVRVYEEWNYAYRRIADGSVARDVQGLGQGLRYALRREGTRWLVAGWIPEEGSRPQVDEGFKW
ncbi:MAG TPA: hypothetical protein VLT61_14580 [Anaeromyxobacteraceae bacterium]|nr:hypothetical protein [Anaeromyxobacteraceae bacterium]